MAAVQTYTLVVRVRWFAPLRDADAQLCTFALATNAHLTIGNYGGAGDAPSVNAFIFS